MGDWDKKPQELLDNALKKVQEEQTSFLSEKEIEQWLMQPVDLSEHYCCLVYGNEGSGKTGVCLDILTGKDITEGKNVLVIDLDGGNLPLISRYHKEASNNFIVQNPMTHPRAMKIEGDDIKVDYNVILSLIKGIVNVIALRHKELKIKAVVFDGLSTFLKICENIMRMEKHLTPDGGVNNLYWKIRSKHFLETILAIKSLPINKFFIAHEDFIDEEDIVDSKEPKKKKSNVVLKTNQEMHQKVRCIREDKGDQVIFKAIIDKNKFKVSSEGKEIIFCTVDKATEKAEWDTKKIYKSLM